ncbi:MarR family winged helix-turn-helix transcriptional regulator [Secundilactobacillus oryzae]|nr:MarR family transcriptional regulator [Secundilactobacillus oryzae]
MNRSVGVNMDQEKLLDSFIEAYMQSIKYLDEFISEPAADYHLSFEQYMILHDIARKRDLTLVEIANNRHVTRSAISRQIKVLLSQNYIIQVTDESDRRRLYLRLTDAGEEVERIVSERNQARFQGWIDHYGEERAKDILEFIQDFSHMNKIVK